MKIAYAIAATNYNHSGIKRRVLITCSQFQNFGHQIDLFPISTTVLNRNYGWFANDLPFDPHEYDAIILRSILLGKDAYRNISKVPTFPERHLALKSSESSKDQIRRIWEQFVFNPLDFSHGIFYVTSEIARLDGLMKPNLVVGNSALDLNLFGLIRHPIKGRVGMSVGNSARWTGLDLFYELAQMKPGYQFVIAAPRGLRFQNDLRMLKPRNVEFFFANSYSEYVDEIRTWSYAIGPLALDRKGLSEAAPLKVRDYVSLGIPTFINYLDTNLQCSNDAALMQVDITDMRWKEAFLEWLQLASDLQINDETKNFILPKVVEEKRINFIKQRLESSS